VTHTTENLRPDSAPAHQELSQDLLTWLRKARAAGLDAEGIEAIVQRTIRSEIHEEQAV
jgi:hypothetical protein